MHQRIFLELKLEGKRKKNRKPTVEHIYEYSLNDDGTAILRVDDGRRRVESLVDAETIDILRENATRLYTIANANDEIYILAAVNGRNKPITHLVVPPGPDEVVDHLNGDTLDNRRENLRAVDRATNQRNRRVSHTNKTGFRGVHENKQTGKWTASIFLGQFDTPEEAAKVYREAYERLFPGVLFQE
ncbi:HNH endonuclease [Thermoactinomyces daqus]|uniref:HNH endonuclease n=1 Tax=Thermoactinomyces daqus TaxID=1329516 RepID=A0A7W2AHS4_9BACL|nr:HNH endonuclease [Thermoactinomyces daqus]MBA4542024.1 HNH endonuclease [Thermoactinomyces daqus]